MKALFIAPSSHEPCLIVQAWNSFNEPAVHRIFDVWGEPDDEGILNTARDTAPDVIFYVGANKASGLPSIDTLCELRTIASSVHLCWDAADDGWKETLRSYKGCFDLQVALDGVLSPLVDMATLTPVDPRPYMSDTPRRVRCAFSGQNAGRAALGQYQHPRYTMLNYLVRKGLVEYHPRTDSSYEDYAEYLKSCRMLVNFSHTGSGLKHHCKVRITEAGMAGCALLEMVEAPTRDWIPEECLFIYRGVEDAAEMIQTMDSTERIRKAAALKEHVWENY
ncbi:hypothetical protein LCGC14_2754730, partial [marine sediment metagenome]